MIKKLTFAALIVILSFLTFLIFQLSKDKGKKTGFDRSLEGQKIEFIKMYQLPPALFFFTGNSEKELYLKNLRYANADLYSIDYALSTLKRTDFKEYLAPDLRSKKLNIGVLDTAVYLTDEQSGALTIIPKNRQNILTYKDPKIWIDQTKLFSKQSLIGRGMVLKGGDLKLNLTKVNYLDGKIEKVHDIKCNKNNYFSADGLLQYDKYSSRLLFMYYYSGDFMSLDTNLNEIYNIKTIDKTPYAEVKIAKINKKTDSTSRTNVTQAGPTKIINRTFTLYKDKMYVLSTVKADNESDADFRKNQVVDVYSIENGKYNYSFYIPKHQGQKLRTIIVKDNFVYGIFGSILIKYKLA